MPWPTTNDYYEAVQNLGVCAFDEELRAGELAVNAMGLPLLWTGSFANVFRVRCPRTGNTWALKCFTHETPGLRERYRHIAAHLAQARLPFTVEFRYLEPGLRAGGMEVPVLKMHWVEGQTLNRFVQDSVNQPKTLATLLELWVKLSQRLRQTGIAHADLQHGNVLLVPRSQGRLALKLIDYDGMYVPALSGTHSGELGHRAYQHPRRTTDRTYSAEVDRFSHLVIYTAIRCLIVGRESLWDRFQSEDNLLFGEKDFQHPGDSEVFRTLWELDDPDCRALVGRLALACEGPLEAAPLLEEVVRGGTVLPMPREEEMAAKALLAVGAPAASQATSAKPVVADSSGSLPWWAAGAGGPAKVQPPPIPATVPVSTAGTGTEPAPTGEPVEALGPTWSAADVRRLGIDAFLLPFRWADRAAGNARRRRGEHDPAWLPPHRGRSVRVRGFVGVVLAERRRAGCDERAGYQEEGEQGRHRSGQRAGKEVGSEARAEAGGQADHQLHRYGTGADVRRRISDGLVGR